MVTNEIRFTTGYKYVLQSIFIMALPDGFQTAHGFDSQHVKITKDGLLVILAGFAWDGATNAIDTKSVMRSALVHDALYYALRQGFKLERGRELADKLFREMSIADRMSKARAWWQFVAVRKFGAASASMPRRVEVLTY
jgi:hypothetical protein